MSRLLKFRGVVLAIAVLMLIAGPKEKAQAQPNVTVTFQTFYNSLQPYGRWIDYPNYGYCWVPDVGRDFRPYYSNGYWAMTEYGNTWVSNYSWGWAPFHYGNWTYDDYYGWIWVPGNTWGPAWVSWRNGAGHYGWAPIAPGVNINVAIGPRYNCAPNWWVFVPHRHIYAHNFHNHWRGPRYNNTYIRQTTIINNTYINNNHRYVSGPSRSHVQRVTGQRVRTYGVRSGMRPGKSYVRGNNVNIYRPAVQKRTSERPQRYVNATQGRGGSTQRATTATQRGSSTAPRSTQRATTAQRSTQRSAPATQQRRATSTQRATTTQRSRATAPTQRSSSTAARANTPTTRNRNVAQRQQQAQQQGRITQRRQQSWQNRSQNTQRSGTIQRSNSRSTNTRAQAPTHRNTQRVRPQSQSRPQTRTRATQSRSTSRGSTVAPQRSSRSSGGTSRGTSRRR